MDNTQPATLTGRGKHFLKMIEFDADEKLVCEIRKHPFGLFLIQLSGGIITLILFGTLVILPYMFDMGTADVGFDFSSLRSIIVLFGVVISILSIAITAITGYLYQANVVLVTSEKIAQQIYRTLFDHRISQLSIGDIQDVTVFQRGVFAKIFNYGTLVIETAGEQNNYVFNYSTNPYENAKLIVGAHEEYIARYGN